MTSRNNDVTGEVLAGPAPRVLDHLPTKIEEGRLPIIFKEFKPGQKVPIAL